MKVRPVHWREAEAFAKKRLDRRRSYAIGPAWCGKGRELLESVEWVDSCSGCCELGEYNGMAHLYPLHPKHRCHVGGGCHECGYHGIRRNGMWVPAEMAESSRATSRLLK